jgi:hypothetical protein
MQSCFENAIVFGPFGTQILMFIQIGSCFTIRSSFIVYVIWSFSINIYILHCTKFCVTFHKSEIVSIFEHTKWY